MMCELENLKNLNGVHDQDVNRSSEDQAVAANDEQSALLVILKHALNAEIHSMKQIVKYQAKLASSCIILTRVSRNAQNVVRQFTNQVAVII